MKCQRHSVFILLFSFTGILVSEALQVSICRGCDSQFPKGADNDDCSLQTGHIEICKEGTQGYFCSQQFTMTKTGLRISKGCATNSTCATAWSKNSAQCSSVLNSPSNADLLHVGVQCTFCYLPESRSNYKKLNLVTYGSVASVTKVTTKVTPKITTKITSKVTTKVTSGGTSVHIPTSHVTSYSAASMLCASCNYDGLPEHESCLDQKITCRGATPLCMTSYVQTGINHLLTKRCASVDECSDLWWKRSSHRSDCMSDKPEEDPFTWTADKSDECHYCCQTTDDMIKKDGWWCNHNARFTKPRNLVNMTEYILLHKPKTTTTTQMPSSSTTSTTKTTQGTTTLLTTDVTTKQPTTTPTTVIKTEDTTTMTSTGTITQSPTTLSTSKTTMQTITTSLPTTASTTSGSPQSSSSSSTAEPKSGVLCSSCQIDGILDSRCLDHDVIECPVSTPYCLTEAYFTGDHGMTTHYDKRCSSQSVCESKWQSTNGIKECEGDMLDKSLIGKSCSFCCNDSGINDVPCNRPPRPRHVLVFNSTQQYPGSAQTTSLPDQLTTTQIPQTTQSMTSFTTLGVTRRCVQCGDAAKNQPCGSLELLLSSASACEPGHDYCLNTIVQTGTKRSVYKQCATLTDCREKWFKQSSDKSTCINYNPLQNIDSYFTCHFCCITDNCNKPYMPDTNTLWRQ